MLDEFNLTEPDVTPRRPGDLSDLERRILDAMGMGIETVDDLAERLPAPASEVLAVLTGLEIRGLLMLEPGGTIREPLAR